MSQLLLLNQLRQENLEREHRNREFVGGVFFLVAVEMVILSVLVANVMAYALPMRRLEGLFSPFGNPKFTSILYSVIVSVLFFSLLLAGGLTGIFVGAFLIVVLIITLCVVIGIRRFAFKSSGEDDGLDFGGVFGQDGAGGAGGDGAGGDADDDPLGDGVARGRRASFGFGKLRRTQRDKNPWTMLPAPMARTQLRMIIAIAVVFGLVFIVMLTVTLAWRVPKYQLVDMVDNAVIEYQPQSAAKALQIQFAFPGTSTFFHLGIYARLATQICGRTYTKALQPDEKEKKIKEKWIDAYSINMSLYVPSDYKAYDSVNAWFTRPIDLNQRPIPAVANAVLSPADSRMLIYRTLPDALVWFKGYSLDWRALVGGTMAPVFDNGGLIIARLAPQDYHRFHAPVAGVIEDIYELPGGVLSVFADAVRSGNDVFLNQRKVVIINAGSRIGRVAYVGIGATCVGSVLMQRSTGEPLEKGTFIKRGEQMGIMQFGGSTVAVLFEADRVVFDDDIVYRSRFPVETYVQVRSQIGSSR